MLFWGSQKHQKCDFTSKYDPCDDCDTTKSWLTIRLRILIFGILKKSLKLDQKRKNVSFLLKCFFHYVETKPVQSKHEEETKLRMRLEYSDKTSFLTELVLFRRSEKSILVKWTRFCLFKRIFKIFSRFRKSKTSNLL